ncbi:MAG TPA: ketoacyl-ACP synthase III [Pseudomonadales bacterium]|jgi:3-oxoacyl-[acyl-carrier-protein] synthase-3
MSYAAITGWGHCVPPAVLTNADLATVVDTSDEWIVSRTGISERRITHVGLSELAYVAAARALACAGMAADDIDVIILATASGDDIVPNTASRVQQLLGATNAAVFDLNAACTGFLYGLNTGTAFIRSGMYQKVLVIGADRLSWFLDWSDRATCVLFGDGAGAVVLEASDQPAGVQSFRMGCDGEARHILQVNGYGTAMNRFTTDGVFDLSFEGQEIFKRAIRGMSGAAEGAMAELGITADEIDLVIPHQANSRIIQTLAKQMNVPMEKVMVNVHKFGNTSAASVPIALSEALSEGRVRPGALLLSAAFGAGLTWASVVIRWGDRVTPKAVSDVALPPCEQSALALIAEAVAACSKK